MNIRRYFSKQFFKYDGGQEVLLIGFLLMSIVLGVYTSSYFASIACLLYLIPPLYIWAVKQNTRKYILSLLPGRFKDPSIGVIRMSPEMMAYMDGCSVRKRFNILTRAEVDHRTSSFRATVYLNWNLIPTDHNDDSGTLLKLWNRRENS